MAVRLKQNMEVAASVQTVTLLVTVSGVLKGLRKTGSFLKTQLARLEALWPGPSPGRA